MFLILRAKYKGEVIEYQMRTARPAIYCIHDERKT